MLDLKRQKEHFKGHVATFTDYGNIKILDFKKPNSSNYRIRFLFEEDYCRLHISGDLGELIATNYYNMTWEKFARDYIGGDTGYFECKIDCCSRSIYEFDEDAAKEDLKEYIKDYEWEDEILDYYDSVDDFIDYVLEDYGQYSDRGISESGYEALTELDVDAWEYAHRIGRRKTGILDLYLLAFELATEQLNAED